MGERGEARGRVWRGVGLALALTALGACAGPAGRSDLQAQAEPRPVPDLRFVDAAGRQRSLAEFRGRAVLLNVWAPWCEPCRNELDSLDGLEARLGGPDFEVVAVSMDMNGPGGVARFYEKHGIRRLGVYADPNYAASRVLGARGIPTTLLIDKEGREVGRALGAQTWDGPRMLEAIERLLGRQPIAAPGASAG